MMMKYNLKDAPIVMDMMPVQSLKNNCAEVGAHNRSALNPKVVNHGNTEAQ